MALNHVRRWAGGSQGHVHSRLAGGVWGFGGPARGQTVRGFW